MKIDQQHFYSSIAHYYDQIFPLNLNKVSFVESHFEELGGKSLLDVGCSTGEVANALAEKGGKVYGIDLNSEMIAIAKGRFPSFNLKFLEASMLNLDEDFGDLKFDGIYCFGNTLVHLNSLSEIGSFLSTARRHLNVGGKLMIQILNYDYILDNEITDLPLVDTDTIGFIRRYDLPSKPGEKLVFNTELIIKETRDSHFHASYLLPLRKSEIEILLQINGFGKAKFYSSFDKRPFGGNYLPMVFVTEKLNV